MEKLYIAHFLNDSEEKDAFVFVGSENEDRFAQFSEVYKSIGGEAYPEDLEYSVDIYEVGQADNAKGETYNITLTN